MAKTKKPWRPRWTDTQLRADLEWYHARDWAKALKAYEAEPKDFYAAYEFLRLHPANQRRIPLGDKPSLGPDPFFHENLTVMVVKVDPKTKRVEMRNTKNKGPKFDTKRNTLTQVWVEWGPYIEATDLPRNERDLFPRGVPSHDPRVDTGGATYEEAIVNLAHNVYALYEDQPTVPDDAKLKKRARW